MAKKDCGCRHDLPKGSDTFIPVYVNQRTKVIIFSCHQCDEFRWDFLEELKVLN